MIVFLKEIINVLVTIIELIFNFEIEFLPGEKTKLGYITIAFLLFCALVGMILNLIIPNKKEEE